MNEIIEKEIITIENMIYEINGVEAMLDSEISITKWRCYLYDKVVITLYDTDKPKSILINFADTSAKLEGSQKI